MEKNVRIFLLFLLLLTASNAFAITPEQAISKANELAAQQQYDDALAIVENASKQYPKNTEIKLSIARIFSWMGNYAASENMIRTLGKEQDKNADVILLRANLAYYQQDYATAIKLYKRILEKNPNYQDATTGLAQAKKALSNPENISAKYSWQMDAGYENSSFSRSAQTSWNQEFTQLTHFTKDHNTAIYGKITRYDQFKNIDSEYEAGVTHIFTDYFNAYASGAISPSPDFRPENKVSAGGALRAISKEYIPTPLWLTLDSHYDTYSTTKILGNSPGLRLELPYGWSIASRLILVDQIHTQRVYGRDFRIDGVINDRLNFYAGYANAPETVAAVTVQTKTYFGGIAFNVRPDTTLRLGYTHDDRENSYIRQGVIFSVSYRF